MGGVWRRGRGRKREKRGERERQEEAPGPVGDCDVDEKPQATLSVCFCTTSKLIDGRTLTLRPESLEREDRELRWASGSTALSLT